MARIRTIKPEFWTDEKVVELSAFARLLFIGLWNFCDDEGRIVFSPKRLKMQIFPSDEVDCATLIKEIEGQGLVIVYDVDGTDYLQVTGFPTHQKIDKRSPSKLPCPPNSPEFHRISSSPADGREGKGRDQGRDQGRDLKGDIASDTGDPLPRQQEVKPECPHQKIIALYHEILPMCPQVRDWTPARAQQLRARWNEDQSRQSLDYWRRFFEYVKSCPFLVGASHKPQARPFFADLEWMTKSANFTKIREQKYE